MGKKLIVILTLFALSACKKPDERACFKNLGDTDSLVIPFAGNFDEFVLGGNIKYEFYQDSSYQIVVKGGKNVIPFIEATDQDTALVIQNKNRCNFLRDGNSKITVELHFPEYKQLSGTPDDSVTFKDTISGSVLEIEFLGGACSMVLNVDLNILKINLAFSAGDFYVGGQVAVKSDLVVKTNAYGNATALVCPYYFLHNRSNADLHVNLEASSADIFIAGTGDIYYTGNPFSTIVSDAADGELIAE